MRSAQHHHPAARSAGFTLVELLVTLAVVALLAALVLPAVQRARESSRRVQCVNNLKQLGIAAHGHEAMHRAFPATAAEHYVPERSVRSSFSPHARLLPFLDQQALYDQLAWDHWAYDFSDKPPLAFCYDAQQRPEACNEAALSTTVAVFLCPSTPRVPGGNHYRACMGAGPGVVLVEWSNVCVDPLNMSGAFVNGRAITAGEIRDGLSNTAFFCERVAGDGNPDRYDPWADVADIRPFNCTAAETRANCGAGLAANAAHDSYNGNTWLFGGWRQTWYNHVLPPNSAVPDCMNGGRAVPGGGNGAYSARSLHPGGVNLLFADGAVKFISQTIDLQLWLDLSTRAGAEPGS